jgi:hypothetical protein
MTVVSDDDNAITLSLSTQQYTTSENKQKGVSILAKDDGVFFRVLFRKGTADAAEMDNETM